MKSIYLKFSHLKVKVIIDNNIQHEANREYGYSNLSNLDEQYQHETRSKCIKRFIKFTY